MGVGIGDSKMTMVERSLVLVDSGFGWCSKELEEASALNRPQRMQSEPGVLLDGVSYH